MTNQDRERYDELATLYGLIISLDYLERAYVRDSITQSQSVPLPPLKSDGDRNPPLLPREPDTAQHAPASSLSSRPS